MIGFRKSKEFRLTWRQCAYLMLYMLVMVVVLVVLHEGAHILAAMALGACFSELELGFIGINPAVILPECFAGPCQTIVRYAGGLATGTIFLVFYLTYWVRKYQRNPGFFVWSLGAVTLMMAAMQYATGYLEGCYHAAYIAGAMEFFSPTEILIYGWAAAAILFHSALCPTRKMKEVSKAET